MVSRLYRRFMNTWNHIFAQCILIYAVSDQAQQLPYLSSPEVRRGGGEFGYGADASAEIKLCHWGRGDKFNDVSQEYMEGMVCQGAILERE